MGINLPAPIQYVGVLVIYNTQLRDLMELHPLMATDRAL